MTWMITQLTWRERRALKLRPCINLEFCMTLIAMISIFSLKVRMMGFFTCLLLEGILAREFSICMTAVEKRM